MSDESISQRLIVKESPGRGRGVFALRDFEEGELIETVPVIVLPPEDGRKLRLTTLVRYQFNWPRFKGVTAVPLGYAMLHNHSTDPNATWKNDFDENLIHFVAARPIAKGEEITANYGRGKYWKDTVDPPPWWTLPAARLRQGFGSKNSAVMLAAGATGAAIVAIVGRQRRRARQSPSDSPVRSALSSQSRRRASTS